jgi:hypothetical protein
LAISLRATPRRGHLQYLFIAAAVVAAVVAILPIGFAVFGGVGPVQGPKTAFASAPAGDYAVVSRTEGDTDVIAVAPLANPSATTEVARVHHLNGFSTNGAVSPDGKHLALIVPDAGSTAQPSASLVTVDLESGDQQRIAENLDPQQTPLWAPDNASVVVVRNQQPAIQLLRVPVNGKSATTVADYPMILGAYPFAFDAQGRLLTVIIDERGSTLVRDGADVALLSTQITRDWRLSPDGSQVAFIESNLDGGLHYQALVYAFDSPGNAVTAQAQTDGSQQLGVAWRLGSTTPTFGDEHEPGSIGGVTAQSLSAADGAGDGITGGAGFDVPIAYSRDGAGLAVTHWTGPDFAQAGKSSLQVVTDSGRAELPGYAKVLGWAAR